MIEDYNVTGQRAVQDDNLSGNQQLLLPHGVLEDTQGENEHSDDGGLEGYLGRRKTLVKQKQLDNLTFKSSDNDKRSDKDSFNSSLGGWGGWG